LEEKKNNYFYKIINLINGKFYYGIRSTNKDITSDKYMGSGLAIKDAIKKHGRDNFKKEILINFSTRKEASDYEREIVTFELIQLEECYNCRTGGDNGYIFVKEVIDKMRKPRANLSPESREKMGSPWRGKTRSNEFKKNLSEMLTGEGNHFYGKTHTPENRQRHSERFSGENHPFFGTKRSKETVEKIILANTGKKRSEEVKKAMSDRRKGIRSSPTKPCIVDGVYFAYMVDIAHQYKVSQNTVTKRMKSDDWPTWQYINQDVE
jgi:group I intron endonuclease